VPKDRSRVVSSFTVIKGSLIGPTYEAFQGWDYNLTKRQNLDRMAVGASSANWQRDVSKTLNRRFDPEGRDRALVELAKARFDPEAWRPLLLWHMTRDEFLVRDFLVGWLYPQFTSGTFRVRTEDVLGYVKSLTKRKSVVWSGKWSDSTTSRVASGLLRLACDFGLMHGSQAREFASFHLPDPSLLYLLHAMSEAEPNARKMIQSKDWRMYLMDASDVEREILRLHQFRNLHYEVAGSLSQLELPHRTALDCARGLCA